MLVLSPHRDDAAFSCGLFALWLLRLGGSLTVVNVCTRSDYAPYLPPQDSDWVTQVSNERFHEDHRFYQKLLSRTGAQSPKVQGIDLHWLDAPLRLAVATESVLAQHGPDEDEVRRLAAEFATLPNADAVLAPLALGGHLDHRLVREAASQVFSQNLGWYEDLPYAARMTPAQRSTELNRRPASQCWSPGASEPVGTKHDLAMCYPSQIAPDVANEMEVYGQDLRGRERLYLREGALQALANFEERSK